MIQTFIFCFNVKKKSWCVILERTYKIGGYIKKSDKNNLKKSKSLQL